MVPSVDDILSELSWASGYFPEDALRAALRYGPELVPQLIETVELVTKEPDGVTDSYVLHVCAMFLLAQMRERRAYRPIVEMCRLPDDQIDHLIGDVLTEDLPQILASVAQDDDTLLRELVEDGDVAPYARVAALQAMACSAVERVLDRDRFVGYLTDLLRGNVIPRRAGAVWDEAACIATDLGLELCIAESLRAFDEGLVSGMVISRQEIVDGLQQASAPFVPTGPERYEFVTDAIEELRGWQNMWRESDELDDATMRVPEPHRRGVKIGRNDPCPCGSGKKYKKCCGKMGTAARA